MKTTHYLRERREALGLSQAQLAARLQTLGMDVTQPWISALERGQIRPTWDMLPYIARALDTDPNTMVGWREFLRMHQS